MDISSTTVIIPHICMLTARFYPFLGGTEQQVAYLSKKLIETQSNVFILTQRYPTNLPKIETKDGFYIIRLLTLFNGFLGSLIFMISTFFWLIVNSTKYDIIHAHLASSPAIAAVILGKLFKKIIIIKFAGARKTGDIGTSLQRPFGSLKLKFFKSFGTNFVCPSNEVYDEMVTHNFDKNKITIIPNGVDTTKFCPVNEKEKKVLRTKLNLNDGVLFIYTGRLQSGKGLDILIKSWSNIVKQNNKLYLLLVGDGILITELTNLHNSLNLQNSIIFTGKVDNVHEFLQASDVFVSATTGEGMSNALLEAMSCGLASIITNIPANLTVFGNTKSWLLFAPNNITELSNNIQSLANNSEQIKQFGNSARKRVLDNFNLDIVTKKYVSYYKKLLGETN